MRLEKYLSELPLDKRVVLLGKDTEDSLHKAFDSKRVVHAGLIGEPIPVDKQEIIYNESLRGKSDLNRHHAVYIHIPFCQTKCLYCGFYQNASRQEAEDEYVEALLSEIESEAKSSRLQGTPIDCVFIGGGTPTSLSVENAAKLLGTVQTAFNLKENCEVTLEGRIHDLVPEKIEVWLNHGVNRISLGVQSFDTILRQRIGRLDTREEVLRRIKLLKSYDVTIIVDLIYGLPGQTMELWLEDVRTLDAAGVDGMDLYQLNIFPGGPLAKAVARGTVPACADIAGQADMYMAARNYLLKQGAERLSLCHWRRNKRERSLYNSLAKAGAEVYAFGCGAGGHFGNISYMNQRALPAYLEARQKQQKPLMMAGFQVEKNLGRAVDCLISSIKTRDVVVTASRTEQELKETPTAAEVITREELERTGANTLTEALKRSANINVTQSAMGNNVSLRGMNNNQTLILINGRRIRTEDTNDSANKYELNRVNMANVDHIEIIRGAASSLYGSEAMGGVINIITKKDAKESVTFGGDWTTHETDAYFHASTGRVGKWAVDIDGKYSKTRNWGYLGSTAQVISMGGSNTYSMVTQSTNQYGERYFFDIDGRYAIDKDKEWDIFFDYIRTRRFITVIIRAIIIMPVTFPAMMI